MTSWNYRDDITRPDDDLIGYDVEATDGRIGSIDEASNEAGSSYIVVDTGFWIFGKKRMIPAGVIQNVNAADRAVYVNMTKDQIKNAPDFDERHRDSTDRGDYTYYDNY